MKVKTFHEKHWRESFEKLETIQKQALTRLTWMICEVGKNSSQKVSGITEDKEGDFAIIDAGQKLLLKAFYTHFRQKKKTSRDEKDAIAKSQIWGQP